MLKPVGVPNDDRVTPITYEFKEPLLAHVRYPDGSTVLTGYGIGEKIDINEPSLQYLIARSEVLNDLLLSDGSTILDVPNLEMRRIWTK